MNPRKISRNISEKIRKFPKNTLKIISENFENQVILKRNQIISENFKKYFGKFENYYHNFRAYFWKITKKISEKIQELLG